jgi:hypothetical protein
VILPPRLPADTGGAEHARRPHGTRRGMARLLATGCGRVRRPPGLALRRKRKEARKSSRDRISGHRAVQRQRGLHPVMLWLPDVSDPGYRARLADGYRQLASLTGQGHGLWFRPTRGADGGIAPTPEAVRRDDVVLVRACRALAVAVRSDLLSELFYGTVPLVRSVANAVGLSQHLQSCPLRLFGKVTQPSERVAQHLLGGRMLRRDPQGGLQRVPDRILQIRCFSR